MTPGARDSLQHLAGEFFRRSVAVVGAGVDEIPAPGQVSAKRRFVIGVAIHDSVAAETEYVAVEAGRSQRAEWVHRGLTLETGS